MFVFFVGVVKLVGVRCRKLIGVGLVNHIALGLVTLIGRMPGLAAVHTRGASLGRRGSASPLQKSAEAIQRIDDSPAPLTGSPLHSTAAVDAVAPARDLWSTEH